MIARELLDGAAAGPVPTVGSWIGGAMDVPTPEAPLIDVLDPATGRVIARIVDAGTEGVGRAVAAAEEAAPGWRAVPARERGALIAELARRIEAAGDDLARLDSLDTGNPLAAMRADVTKGSRLMHDSAGLALQATGTVFPLAGLHYTQREPWGVVGRMITFNHPVMFACARLGAALVTGNTVVLKASELAPLAPLAIAELADEVLPPGVVNVVTGGPATGNALVQHPSIQRLSFTGSTATALRIQAAAAASGRMKTMTFELGGKNPIVVFPDADVDEVSSAIVRGMNFTRVQGQSCGSTSRLVVHDSIADAVLERVAAKASQIRVGMPLDPDAEMGAMISAGARDRALGVVERAVRGGARVLTGGGAPHDPGLADGFFLQPTVLDGVAPGSEAADEEVFGPVLAAMTFTNDDEAVALANEGRYGLTAAIWTNDIDRALRTAERIEAGYLWINDVETRFPAVPFGGWGDSGVGLEHGLEEILSFTRVKAVNIRIR